MKYMPYRCTVLSVVVLASLAAVALAAEKEKPRSKALNVLFLFSDDQRFDTIHALENDRIQTPTLDRLVESGFTFRNNYIQGAQHGAVCIPSRAMLNSGRTLWHADNSLNSGPLLGAAFRAAGYFTIGIGKWHNGEKSFARAFCSGKSAFFRFWPRPYDHFKVPVFDMAEGGKFSKEHIGNKFSSALFADAAIDFLRTYHGKQPFFAYVAFMAPHDPRTPPGDYATMYRPASIPLPGNFMAQHPFDNGELWIRDELLAPHPRTVDLIRKHMADYYGMITNLDWELGRILKVLKETGHENDTIVVFSSDNGLAIGEHGLMGKQSLYDYALRTPLIFAGPGISHGASDALVYLLDVFPTLCDLTRVPIPEGVEGKSLTPVLDGRKGEVRDYLFAAYRNCQRMMRDSRWKLIKYHVSGAKTVQLFDLRNDPWELNNLADDPALAGERQRLEVKLAETRKQLGDPVKFERKGSEASPHYHYSTWTCPDLYPCSPADVAPPTGKP